ncbi:E3 ubiquitin-protein ligase UBR2-like protein [Leptotrombidium deliense]|uniref:E3 ubiquitin-protein ligase n=1 Tax=Leptotrombidium deliense TaxID=299467 RepID=A0A443SER9_9ACAR|nr:E3 ubiquitin-protein ligase UBR2-like protein [Leptotrombidium deliense]
MSPHRNHKYKMSISGGGGYCDCGDVEAWKDQPFCNTHLQGYKKSQTQATPLEKLPSDLAERVRLIIEAVVHYCFEVLTLEHSPNLPEDLQYKGSDEHIVSADYATMLFNDEIHTYEQVINTLNRAIECSQKDAIGFATTVDREGRSIVKCAPFQICSQIKSSIEKLTNRHGSKPLRVDVIPTTVIAHQTYAMRLLSWLQQIIAYCEGFACVFSSVAMQPFPYSDGESKEGQSSVLLLERIMRVDVQLWKIARSQWHQLFITGLLMEPNSKKQFAKVFTRLYGQLVKDFINDDHEHSVSIVSLSVQLFTVPSLAHSLIAEDDALSIVTRAFLDECKRHRSHTGKLAFERNHVTMTTFRRAQYILYDLKYLLSVKPKEWNDPLRKNFYSGFQRLIDLLESMQGMDSVVRQVGQHVEFEAEWETGINLQLKLAPVLTLFIDWCGTDKVVLLKALRAALGKLDQKREKSVTKNWNLCGIEAQYIDYDVSSQPVTIHLPLSRVVAGLLLHLTRYDINYNSEDFIVRKSSSPIQLMELPLRTAVMIAQFRAGMWRRNGYSLVNQVYFYHNVRLREEMYDRDILMLQYVASLIDPNEYLINLLNKFGLFVWTQENYEYGNRKPEEDFVRQTITLVEEFLNLLLIIVSERHTPGVAKVTIEDRLKKEIIQWLCFSSVTHSDLLKCLPKESSCAVTIEKIMQEVAIFKKPANQSGGKYELKDEYYSEFNPFFYHFTRQDQSTAEEVQIKRKKQLKEKYICCPPPIPPEFSSQFLPIRNLLQCDVLFHVMNLVLQRTNSTYSMSYSETQFEKVMHIIGVALHEEERALNKVSNPDECDFVFTELAEKKGILDLLRQCVKCPRIGSHKDLLLWVIEKFDSVSKLRSTSKEPVSLAVKEELANTSTGSRKPPSKNAELSAQRRARIMEQMSAMQKNFIKEHADFFKCEMERGMETPSMDFVEDVLDETKPIAVGINQRGKVVQTECHICILCREQQEISDNDNCMVLAAFVQQSTVLSKNRERNVNSHEDNIETLWMPSDLYFGAHISTCGHVMHSECWQKFFDSVLAKERRRPLRYGRHVSFDVDKYEYLCPLCECLSNCVIPLIPAVLNNKNSSLTERNGGNISMAAWLNFLYNAVAKVQPIWVKDPSMTVETGEKYICRFKANPLKCVLENIPTEEANEFREVIESYEKNASNRVLSSQIQDMTKALLQSIYTIGLNVHPNADDDRVPVMSYWACAFTIHAIEKVSRVDGKGIFIDLSSRRYNCLQALVRYVAVSSAVYNAAIIRSHGIRLLRYLLVNEHYVTCRNSCLDVDAFGLLVSLVLSSPSLYVREEDENPGCVLTTPSGNIFDRHYVNLVVVFHLIQIILTNPCTEELMEIDTPNISYDDIELGFMAEFYNDVLVAAAARKENKPQPQHLIFHLKSKLLPFLRCTAIFFHFLTNVVPPPKLKSVESNGLLSCEEEFNILAEYLGFSSKFSDLLSCASLRQLALCWARHPRVNLLASQGSSGAQSPSELPLRLVIQPHEVNHLITLPHDYSELINSVSQFTCPNSDGDESRSPTMCLVCGQIFCSQSYCCQMDLEGTMVGACTYHAHFCGAGVGIFLRIRDCKILLLAGKTKGCYMSPPFIDEYGETDQGLLRGNPLHLCRTSFRELHKLWLRHGIPEQIAHALEMSSNLAATNWQLL